MNYLHNPAAPWEIILESVVEGFRGDLTATIVPEIIRNQRDLEERDYPILAKVFDTSEQFWRNLQLQFTTGKS